ncbi:MAG: type I methionyl aminopeptidase [Candidatus Sungbacteria bacterium]|nr:type I methionyl aminopeptidase [Candidatus Sungbacteria bacterium]
MITIKTPEEIETLKRGGHILGRILSEIAESVRPGISTKDLDDLAERLILASGGEPSFKGYNPYGAKAAYPSALCVSVNDEVVHAIPHRKRILEEGDIVGLDIGMWWPDRKSKIKNQKSKFWRPMATDTAVTVGVGKISKTAEKLIRVTKEALELGIKEVRAGAKIGDIGAAIQKHIEKYGFGVVRDLAGHGVGYKVHEDPFVPNYGTRGEGLVLKEGMVIAIEPMATEGTWKVILDKDEWCFRTADGKLAAHFEHTVAVTKNGAKVLTLP